MKKVLAVLLMGALAGTIIAYYILKANFYLSHNF